MSAPRQESALLAPTPRWLPNRRFSNWGGGFSCTPARTYYPNTVEEVRAIVSEASRYNSKGQSGSRPKVTLRAVGVGHSPSDLPCLENDDGWLLVMTSLNAVKEVNTLEKVIRVQPGITLHDLHTVLTSHNLAMSNIGSISDQTLGGVITTPTHGTGMTFEILASHVLSLELVTADNRLLTCSPSQNADVFQATLCGMGATGVIVEVTLNVEEEYMVEEETTLVPLDYIISRLRQHGTSNLAWDAEHVRMWYYTATGMVKLSKASRIPRTNAGTLVTPTHLGWLDRAKGWISNEILGHHLVEVMLAIGTWFPEMNIWTQRLVCSLIPSRQIRRDTGWKVANVDCYFPQHTTESCVPLASAASALTELSNAFVTEMKTPLHKSLFGMRAHFPVEIRFSKGDNFWLSPASEAGLEDGKRLVINNTPGFCWIGVTQYKPYNIEQTYLPIFRLFHGITQRWQGRPHWAKENWVSTAQHTPEGDSERHDGAKSALPTDAELSLHPRDIYPRYPDWLKVVYSIDPDGLFAPTRGGSGYLGRRLFSSV